MARLCSTPASWLSTRMTAALPTSTVISFASNLRSLATSVKVGAGPPAAAAGSALAPSPPPPLDPGVDLGAADPLDRDGHVGVAEAAELGALQPHRRVRVEGGLDLRAEG